MAAKNYETQDFTHSRNICILAHVDHGKTTLADSLLAANGIISSRLSGQLRYMDSRPDEQKRGITMKSSAITLAHVFDKKKYLVNLIDSPGHVDFSPEVSTAVRLSDGAVVVVDVVEGVSAQTHAVLRQAWNEKLAPILVLNKIDRLILELQMTPDEAYSHLKALLEQVNAIVATLAMGEALENFNHSSPEDNVPVTISLEDQVFDWQIDDLDDDKIYFEPERGNVVFASALDGWGFSVEDFATILAEKIKCKEEPLRKTLWGDFYLTKDKRGAVIKKGALMKGKSPLFVTLVLQNIWDVYNAICSKKDNEKVTKIAKSMGIKLTPRHFQKSDPKILVQHVFSQWLPLARTVLNMVCNIIPGPKDITTERVKCLMYGTRNPDRFPEETRKLEEVVKSCSSEAEETIVYVSKVAAFEWSALPRFRPSTKELSKEDLKKKYKLFTYFCILEAIHSDGFERKLYFILEHNLNYSAFRRDELIRKRKLEGKDIAPPKQPDEFSNSTELGEAATSNPDNASLPHVGEELTDTVESVKPEGLSSNENQQPQEEVVEEVITEEESPKEDFALIGIGRVFSGTLKVGQTIYVLSPKFNPNNPELHRTEAKIEALYMLMGRSLESVECASAGAVVGIQGLGKHLLKAGTLSTSPYCPSFAAMQIDAKPIVRVALDAKLQDMAALKEGMKLLGQSDPCAEVLQQQTGELILCCAGEVHVERCITDLRELFAKGIAVQVSKPIIPFRETVVVPPTRDAVNEEINEENIITSRKHYLLSEELEKVTDGIITIGTSGNRWSIKVVAMPIPNEITQCIEENADAIKQAYDADTLHTSQEMVVFREELKAKFDEAGEEWSKLWPLIWAFGPQHSGSNILFRAPELVVPNSFQPVSIPDELTPEQQDFKQFANSIDVGFQLLSLNGPLCEEQLMGVAFKVLEIAIDTSQSEEDTGFSGKLIFAAKEAFRQSFLVQPVRLMTPMFKCDLFVNSSSLGKVYGVLNKRNGTILEEDMKEGTDNFIVRALVPVTHSFGFAEDLRKKTSGLAVPQLVFSHWQVIDEDPFWVPSSEEELLHFGEKADAPNFARKYVDDTRKRKGLFVEEKVVEHAEKQRTLGRNK